MRLAVVALGHVHAEDLAALTTRFEHIEQLVLDVNPRDEIAKHRAELNRALDAASTDWVLIVREREQVDDALAQEIAEAMRAAKAWGFRIRSTAFYAGKPLQLTRDEGELRLMHRRHLLRRGELAVQGTVIRLAHALRSMTFATTEEHRAFLAERANARTWFARALVFVSFAIGTRARDANTLRYLWVEAGFHAAE